ncbi:MAG: hypothetical protein AB7I52_17475 [Rhizobiaceae bacterium]
MMNCATCGKEHEAEHFDSKPAMTLRLWLIQATRGQIAMLRYAADHGYDFDRMECRSCYGPGFASISP